ncbi:MAG TPA: sodium-dependent transporter, partial [Subdoligranulum sp.]|nr:sodium-dependent transporter [Subdoligranulum sp.]
VTKWGWGFDKYTAECNTGSGLKMPQWVKPYFKYVLPVLIAVILVQGLL